MAGGERFHGIKNLILVLGRRLAQGNVEGHVPRIELCIDVRCERLFPVPAHPLYSEQLIRFQSGLQVEMKCGLGTAERVLMTRFRQTFQVKLNQNLNNLSISESQ